MLDDTMRDKLKRAYESGTLRVKSMSPQGIISWEKILEVSRAEVWPEQIVRVHTSKGSSFFTAGHRVFVTPTEKLEAEKLTPGMSIEGHPTRLTVERVEQVPSRQYMYDLTVDKYHNFFLHNSEILTTNSPDRNYHFRPPAHEETINQFNQVFGYIWEDEELGEYLEFSLGSIIAAPPRTPFNSIDQMIQYAPEWKTLLLTGAASFALFALMINQISEEFSYSIGGVSLDIEKSSKYEAAGAKYQEMFETQLEKAKQTVKIIRGLQQSKFGMGVRSQMGPQIHGSALTPAKFLGF